MVEGYKKLLDEYNQITGRIVKLDKEIINLIKTKNLFIKQMDAMREYQSVLKERIKTFPTIREEKP